MSQPYADQPEPSSRREPSSQGGPSDDPTVPLPASSPAPSSPAPTSSALPAEPGATGSGPRHAVQAPVPQEQPEQRPLIEDSDQPIGEADKADPPPAPRRRGAIPVPPPLNLGRRLRALAGVDERLMAYVPQEKAWYTSLGGVVLGTATIAAFSMWFAINEALGVTSNWAILAVLVWFFFILSVDRWLVSGRLTGDIKKRVPVLLMRVAMAVLFGIIIAEPLVLRVFQTAVEKHIQDQRAQDLANLAGQLKKCNPAPTVADAPPPAGCTATDILSFSSTPVATTKQLAALRADADKLQATVDADSKKLADLNELARRECNGTPGAGLTGRVGEGPNCHRLRGEADTYAKTHQLGPNAARLTTMRAQITTLEGTAGQNQAAFEAERDSRSRRGSRTRAATRAVSASWSGSARCTSSRRSTSRWGWASGRCGCSSSWSTACRSWSSSSAARPPTTSWSASGWRTPNAPSRTIWPTRWTSGRPCSASAGPRSTWRCWSTRPS